jgi:hypothetical protein
MEVYFLSSLIGIVFIFLIYSSIKTKKIYSENVEYEPKHEETIKKIEKRLAKKGYKFQKISKFECYYYLDRHKERLFLPRIRIYKKQFKNYGLLINNQSESFKDNLLLKKEVFEFLVSKKTYGIIIYNEKNNNFEFAKRKGHNYIFLVIIMIILILSIYFQFK